MLFVIFLIVLIILLIIITTNNKKGNNKKESFGKTRISDITGVINDICIDHYTDNGRFVESCNIKLELDNNNNSNNIIMKHNNKELCLHGCVLHYTERLNVYYKMLNYINNFMKKNNIEWCLYYGSLIGIKFFNDLLPWDPDLDIIVNYDDILMFLKSNGINGKYDFEDSEMYIDIKTPNDNIDIIGRFADKKTLLYCDITFYKVFDDKVSIKKMATRKDPRKFMDIDKKYFYPLNEFLLKDTIVPIPNDIEYNIKERYGTVKEDYIFDKSINKYIPRSQ